MEKINNKRSFTDFNNSNNNDINKLYTINGILEYEGETLNNKKHGKGILYYENGKIKYQGEFKNDKKNGYGNLYYENGQINYEGHFIDDNKHSNNYNSHKKMRL